MKSLGVVVASDGASSALPSPAWWGAGGGGGGDTRSMHNRGRGFNRHLFPTPSTSVFHRRSRRRVQPSEKRREVSGEWHAWRRVSCHPTNDGIS